MLVATTYLCHSSVLENGLVVHPGMAFLGGSVLTHRTIFFEDATGVPYADPFLYSPGDGGVEKKLVVRSLYDKSVVTDPG